MNTQTFRGKKIIYRRGYPAIYYPQHHKAGKNGLVEIHYIIAEEILGRPLNPEEIVHHKDEDRTNYDANNLMVFDTRGSHTSYHQGISNNLDMKLVREGGVWHCECLIPVHHKGKYKDTNLYICPICLGPMKTKTARMCLKCADQKKAHNVPSKEQLQQDLITEKSFCAIGRKYGVSDNAVRKWCKKYNLSSHALTYRKNK